MRLRFSIFCISVVSATSLKRSGTHHALLIHFVFIRAQLTDLKLFTRSTNITSIPNSQPLAGVQFEGNISYLLPLSQKARYVPDVSMLHQDGGNTGSTDYAGPIGRNLSVTSTTNRLAPLLFDAEGRVTAGGIVIEGANLTYTINAIDPETLEILSSWRAPDKQVINFAYIQQKIATQEIVLTTTAGHLFVVQRNNSVYPPAFRTIRDIDLTAYLQPTEVLLNSMYDSESNIWFTTGVILGTGSLAQNSTTIGYVSSSSEISVFHIPGQVVENGIAISEETVFIVTGPSGVSPNNGTSEGNTMGYMYAFSACHISNEDPITTLWSAQYNAGFERKPGGFARGSGTTPTLLGDDYVAITDNAPEQISLHIYHQSPLELSSSQLLCSVPIFTPGQSACDIGSIAHVNKRGDGYEVFLLNDYNAPSIYPSSSAPLSDINGSFNNLTTMASGGVMVSVPSPSDGKDCKIKWQKDIRMTSVPILSTKTGLLYGYEQDLQEAQDGDWVWYVTARDWETGDLIWKVRTGTGGTYNDDFEGNAIGKDGALFQGVVDGTVVVRDGG